MSDFKKNNRFGGASRRPFSGSRPAGNRSFGGRPSSGGRDFGAQKELFKGECASCHKTCEVPFRPNGKKPIYCSDCFRKEDDRPQRDNRHERPFREERSFTPRAPFAAAPKNRDMEDMKVQLASMNATLQKVLVLLQESHAGTVVSAPPAAKTASAPATKAVATKRTSAKKAAPKKVSKTAKLPAPAPKKPVKKAVKKK